MHIERRHGEKFDMINDKSIIAADRLNAHLVEDASGRNMLLIENSVDRAGVKVLSMLTIDEAKEYVNRLMFLIGHAENGGDAEEVSVLRQ